MSRIKKEPIRSLLILYLINAAGNRIKTGFNKEPIEGTFKNEDPDSFVITAENKTRTFYLGTWNPTRMINNQPEAFMEDVTPYFKPDYPKLKLARTYQYLEEQ